MSTSRLLDRLRTWSLHHADVAMARDDRVAPEAAVLDRERAVHRWAVPAEWLAGDAAAERSVRESMPRQVRQAGAVGFALTMPGWVAPDGSIWLLDESVDTGALDEVVLVGVGDRHRPFPVKVCSREGSPPRAMNKARGVRSTSGWASSSAVPAPLTSIEVPSWSA